jgi:hypothetical protein
LIALTAAFIFGVVLVSSGHAQALPAFLEVSNSCAAPGVSTQLTIWGSNVPAGIVADTRELFSLRGLSGNFTVTVPYAPRATDAGATDTVFSGPASGAAGPQRLIRITFPTRQSCPTTAPPPPAGCLPIGQPVPLAIVGLLPFTTAPTVTSWFLDYRGENAGQQSFATTTVLNPGTPNAATATNLPGPLATPGVHQITAISQPPPPVIIQATTVFPLGPDDVYTTFPITICQPPPPPTTTTKPTTPTTVPTTGTTPTTGPTTSTTAPPNITLPTLPTLPTTPTLPPPSPTLTVNPDVGYGGEVTQVHGSGFPPNTTVTLEWQTGIGTVSTQVAADGTFTVGMLVFPHDQVGPRLVHAQGYPPSVSAHFLDELGPEEPPAASNGQWIFREG